MGYGQYGNHSYRPGSSTLGRAVRTKGVITSFRDYGGCARAWVAQQQDHGKSHGERMHFRGAVIYSYGSHFPMARIVGDDAVLVNCDTHGPTTSRHQGEVRAAIRKREFRHVFYIPTRALKAYDNHDAKEGFDCAIEHYMTEAKQSFEKSATARSRRDEYIADAMFNLEEANRFATFYAMPTPFTNTTDLEAAKLSLALDGNHLLLLSLNAAIGARAKALATLAKRPGLLAAALTGDNA